MRRACLALLLTTASFPALALCLVNCPPSESEATRLLTEKLENGYNGWLELPAEIPIVLPRGSSVAANHVEVESEVRKWTTVPLEYCKRFTLLAHQQACAKLAVYGRHQMLTDLTFRQCKHALQYCARPVFTAATQSNIKAHYIRTNSDGTIAVRTLIPQFVRITGIRGDSKMAIVEYETRSKPTWFEEILAPERVFAGGPARFRASPTNSATLHTNSAVLVKYTDGWRLAN